jgi:MFS family permease
MGISFIKARSIILGAISLDLFAVLFGGATALLPIYASSILKIGAVGLGMLRSAPAIGAMFVSLYLARRPINHAVGRSMFIAVLIFGVATLVFAISTSFILSFAALIVLGAADVISVVIRSTLVQLGTPDAMRGRVNSIAQLFIGTSNQLGEFESGITASWFGAMPAVVLGGIGTIAVVVAWIKMFPSLYHVNEFNYDGR